MSVYILPYKLSSESAKALAKELNLKRIDGEKKVQSYSTIINWGKDVLDIKVFKQKTIKIINHPINISFAKNKIVAFNKMKAVGVSVPEYTTDWREAKSWLDESTYIYGRKFINSQQGKGIVIITAENKTFPILPLYTKGIPKCHEYRVHVINNKVIDFSKKRKRSGIEVNPFIKNSNNGWVFCREQITLPDIVKQEAVKAINSFNLMFGAVDILYKEKDNKCWVLEVNTAPGIEGTTLQKYKLELQKIIY